MLKLFIKKKKGTGATDISGAQNSSSPPNSGVNPPTSNPTHNPIQSSRKTPRYTAHQPATPTPFSPVQLSGQPPLTRSAPLQAAPPLINTQEAYQRLAHLIHAYNSLYPQHVIMMTTILNPQNPIQSTYTVISSLNKIFDTAFQNQQIDQSTLYQLKTNITDLVNLFSSNHPQAETQRKEIHAWASQIENQAAAASQQAALNQKYAPIKQAFANLSHYHFFSIAHKDLIEKAEKAVVNQINEAIMQYPINDIDFAKIAANQMLLLFPNLGKPSESQGELSLEKLLQTILPDFKLPEALQNLNKPELLELLNLIDKKGGAILNKIWFNPDSDIDHFDKKTPIDKLEYFFKTFNAENIGFQKLISAQNLPIKELKLLIKSLMEENGSSFQDVKKNLDHEGSGYIVASFREKNGELLNINCTRETAEILYNMHNTYPIGTQTITATEPQNIFTRFINEFRCDSKNTSTNENNFNLLKKIIIQIFKELKNQELNLEEGNAHLASSILILKKNSTTPNIQNPDFIKPEFPTLPKSMIDILNIVDKIELDVKNIANESHFLELKNNIVNTLRNADSLEALIAYQKNIGTNPSLLTKGLYIHKYIKATLDSLYDLSPLNISLVRAKKMIQDLLKNSASF